MVLHLEPRLPARQCENKNKVRDYSQVTEICLVVIRQNVQNVCRICLDLCMIAKC